MAVLFAATLCPQSASAQSEVLAEDALTYPSGTLQGQTGGTGWQKPWGGDSAEGFLATEMGVKVEGKTDGGPNGQSVNAVRRFAFPTPEEDPVYFSVEMKTNEISGQYISILKLHQSPTGEPEHFVGIGIMNNKVFGMGGTMRAADGQFEEIPSSGTLLLVGKIEFAGDSKLTVWLNPKDESATESMRVFEGMGLTRSPFLLVELFVTKLDASGDITFRNVVVSTKWPVPARN